MKERDYGSYIEDIIGHMNYAEEFIRNTTFEEFAKIRSNRTLRRKL